MSSDTPATVHSSSTLTDGEALDTASPNASAPTSGTAVATPAELAAAARQIAIETLRDPAARAAMTSEQKAELKRRAATDPNSSDTLEGGTIEETNNEDRKRAYFDQLARMLVTRNIVTEQIKWIHFRCSTNQEFKRSLDDAVAAKENDPAMLAEKELIMSWRLDVERQKHERVWALWRAGDMERAHRVAAMRARAQESSVATVD